MRDATFFDLTESKLHAFKDVLHESIPLAAVGIYTVWRGHEFIYVGIAGRGLDLAMEHKKARGLKDRLDSHRSGRRSGDQFAVYVCDRLVLPRLTNKDIHAIAAGELSLDARTRLYIHEKLGYRFSICSSYVEAMEIEAKFARGKTPIGPPLLNPGKTRQ